MWTCEDTLAHILGAPYIDDVMSYDWLTTYCKDPNSNYRKHLKPVFYVSNFLIAKAIQKHLFCFQMYVMSG